MEKAKKLFSVNMNSQIGILDNMKTKFIPATVMLLGGAVACVVTFFNHYSLNDMLVVLLLTLLVFLVLGVVIRLIFDSFKLPSDTLVDDEGEVVEKQGEALEETQEEDVDSEEEASYEQE